uniref:Tubulin glycylase 3A n=1 Tax=Lygus hesperus TaxID=30085 RepID=A0A0K8SXX0_LYGHE
MYELKMQLIDRFNKKRMEEKAKAQLNQERLSLVSTVEVSPSKSMQIQTPGELMNLGIGLKRSEMLEKEYQTVANFVPKKRYLQLKLKAEEALRRETTFAICGRSNGWPTVRRYFMARNWIERFASDYDDKRLALPGLQPPPDNDSQVLSRLTARMPAKFVWTEIMINWTLIPAGMIVNKFPASIRPVSTKVGLLLHLNNQVWTYNPYYSFVKHPRSVSLYDDEDMKQLAAQFRMNACVCLLKHLVECTDQEREIVVANGTVPLETADFAVQRVCELVTYHENADLDLWHNSLVSDDEWTLFLLRFHDVAHFAAKFKSSPEYNVQKLVSCAKLCLKYVREFWPDIDVEGVRNLWIIKPSASSCGKGIRIFKTLVDIQNHCRPGLSYLAQKYIERPMFVYKTKFDIRQWFVVSSINPLIIYLYDICYLRFCSREFSLLNLHESIHLSNNSVQCRYSNMTTRNSELPSDNMWDSDTFVNYLRSRKEDDKWYAITLPGIRKGITGAFLASQDMLTHRNNSFNLYGADFMLTEDFVPWLIEINNGPCLRPTTSVTTRLCPMVIQDTISLILKTKHSGTQGALPTNPGNLNEVGRFKLIYSQKAQPPGPNRTATDLSVSAKKARIHNEKYYQERKRPPMGVPMFKDTLDDSPNGTYDFRTLKYEKIANYKPHAMSIVRTTTMEDTKRPPIPPGGVLSNSISEYRTTFKPSALPRPVSGSVAPANSAVSKSSDFGLPKVSLKEEDVKHKRALSQNSLTSRPSQQKPLKKSLCVRRGGISGQRLTTAAKKSRRRGS